MAKFILDVEVDIDLDGDEEQARYILTDYLLASPYVQNIVIAGAADDDDEPDVNDGFPMSVEYDGLWGASDWAVEQAAQAEAEYEAAFFGDE